MSVVAAQAAGSVRESWVRDENRLLDAIERAFGLHSDYALAAWLAVDRTCVSVVRRGVCRLSLVHKITVLDAKGFLGTAKIADLISTAALTQCVLAAAAPRARAKFESDLREHKSDHARLVAACKFTLGFRNDAQLAEYLEIPRNFVSMVRGGDGKLGILTRMKVRARIDPEFPFDKVNRALTEYEPFLEALQ